MNLPFDLTAINTALIIGFGAYLWKQAGVVNQLKQVLTGYEGKGGTLGQIEIMQRATEKLIRELSVLNSSILGISKDLHVLKEQYAHWDQVHDRRRKVS